MLVGTSPFLSPELKSLSPLLLPLFSPLSLFLLTSLPPPPPPPSLGACAALSGRVVHKFGNGSQRTFLVGYFFVRFLCPALAMPVLLGIETSKSLQKLMILMSKMLQAGASGQVWSSFSFSSFFLYRRLFSPLSPPAFRL